MMYHVKEGKLNLPGMAVDYIRFCRGEKPLIMLQGLNTRGIRGRGASLAWMYRRFARDYTVYLYDSLGHAACEEAKDFNQRVYDFLMG